MKCPPCPLSQFLFYPIPFTLLCFGELMCACVSARVLRTLLWNARSEITLHKNERESRSSQWYGQLEVQSRGSTDVWTWPWCSLCRLGQTAPVPVHVNIAGDIYLCKKKKEASAPEKLRRVSRQPFYFVLFFCFIFAFSFSSPNPTVLVTVGFSYNLNCMHVP